MKLVFLASYIAQAYMSLLGIILMPLYMRYMGMEAFGLVGFFLMMQVFFQALDLGLSTTFSREMSLYRAGSLDVVAGRQRLRSVEWLLALIALAAMAALILSRNEIATRWLRIEHLSRNEVAYCIGAMAATAALRLLVGLYRAGLIGLEMQMRAIGIGAVSSTLRYVGVLPLLIFWSAAPLSFFSYQAAVGMIELIAFGVTMHRALPHAKVGFFPCRSALRAMLPMAMTMALITGLWTFQTQIDKLILSRILILKNYGYFTLAVAASGGVLVLVTPLHQVLQPRMTILASQGLEGILNNLYRQVTQFAVVLFVAIGGTLALFAEPLLRLWTGNAQVAGVAAPVLFWYGLANALIGILVVPFLLQFAYGYLRLHVIGNILLGLALLPSLVWAATRFGGTGTGATLLLANSLFLFLWVPVVHRRLMPDIVWTWPAKDVAATAAPVLGCLLIAHWLLPFIQDRFILVLTIGTIFLCSLTLGVLSAGHSRGILTNWVAKRT